MDIIEVHIEPKLMCFSSQVAEMSIEFHATVQANIANSFSSLREAEDFFDVTVAAVDSEQQLQAHKVILAASSGFFR